MEDHILEKLRPYASKSISHSNRAHPDLIDLSFGEPWFGPPPSLLTWCEENGTDSQRLARQFSRYSSSLGSEELRSQIALRYHRKYNVTINPADEIAVTGGGSEAITLAVLAVSQPGDEIIVFDPSYTLYASNIEILGRRPVRVTKSNMPDLEVDFEELNRKCSPLTRMIVLNSPENPTGHVCSQRTIRGLAEFCSSRQLFLLHDEVYDDFVFDGGHVSATEIEKDLEYVISINSLSKRYGVPGLRIGWLVACPRVIRRVAKAHDFLFLSTNGLAEAAATHLLSDHGVEQWVQEQRNELVKRRCVFQNAIADVQGWKFANNHFPTGAFFLFPDVGDLAKELEPSHTYGDGTPGRAVANWLLSEGRIAVVPGDVYGPTGANHIRIVISVTSQEAEEFSNRLPTLRRRPGGCREV